MKKVLVSVISLMILFGIFLFSYIRSLDPGELRRMLLHELEKRIQAQCALENLEINGLGSVYARGLKISTVKGHRIIEVDQLSFHLSLSDLIYSKLRFTSLQIDGLRIFTDKVAEEWTLMQLGLNKSLPSKSPKRLSLVAEVPESSKRPFQIDSFVANDAMFFINGRRSCIFAFHGRVTDGNIHFDSLQMVGPGKTQLSAEGLFELKEQKALLKVSNGSVDLTSLATLVSLIQNGKKPAEVTGKLQLSGQLSWVNSRLIPDLKFESEELSVVDGLLLRKIDGFWNSSQIKALTNLNSFIDSEVQWNLKPYDGNWKWPNLFVLNLNFENIRSDRIKDQRFKSEVAMLINSQVIELRTLALLPVSQQIPDNTLVASGAFSFNSNSGQLKLVSRDLPMGLILPGHAGKVHGEAQLMITEHFGLDYEVYGKVQQHLSEHLKLGDVNFHFAGQVDQENFEVSKFSVDVGSKGSIHGSGLLRFADPLGSLRSVTHFESIPLSEILRFESEIPAMTFNKGRMEIRNQQFTLQESSMKVAGGLVEADLISEVTADMQEFLKKLKGKISLSNLSLTELIKPINSVDPNLPLRISGVLNPEADFKFKLMSIGKAKTSLDLNGKVESRPNPSSWTLEASGVIDLQDLLASGQLSAITGDGLIDVEGALKSEKFQLKARSDRLRLKFKDLIEPIQLNQFSTNSVVNFSGDIESSKSEFGVFNGRVNLDLNGNVRDLKSLRTKAVIKFIDLDSALAVIQPTAKGYFKGKLTANLNEVSYLNQSEKPYPWKISGDFNVSNPTYVYHETVVQTIHSLHEEFERKWLKKILYLEQQNWQKEAKRECEFLDSTPQPLHFENGQLQIQGLELVEKQRKFVIKASRPILLDMPDEFRNQGYLSTAISLSASNRFVKEKFPLLKDSYDKDLNLAMTLEGPLSKPLSEAQINALKADLVSEISANFDPVKLAKAAEVVAKKMSQKVKEALIDKGQNLVNKAVEKGLSKDAANLIQNVLTKSEGSVLKTTAAVESTEEQENDAIKAKVKEKLRSFLQDLF